MEKNYRISPSQINLFLNEPSIWVLNKFFGIYGDMGAAVKRGNAVEVGLNMVLMNDFEYDVALNRAYAVFDQEMENIHDDKTEQERANIAGYLEQAITLFKEIGELPLSTQVRHEPEIFDLPCLGIVDFDYPSFQVDLKTTMRCPSCVENISSEHLRQTTIYNMSSDKPQKLAYVTPKKYALYEVTKEQHDNAKAEILAAIHAMKSAYEIEEQRGREALAVLYPPRDTKSFYWDTKTLNAAQDVWFH